MKKILLSLVLFANLVQADDRNHVLSVATKYGPNGYETYKNTIQTRIQPVIGLSFQESVNNGALVLGFGAYADTTLEVLVGLRF